MHTVLPLIRDGLCGLAFILTLALVAAVLTA